MNKWLLALLIAACAGFAVSDRLAAPADSANDIPTPAASRLAQRSVGDAPNGAAPADQPRLAFAVMSDIHIQSWHLPSHRKLLAALRDVRRMEPAADALVVNGDLTNGHPADYAKLNELMKRAPHPRQLFYTIGNHEYYKAWHTPAGKFDAAGFPHGETEEASIRRFLALTGEPHVYYERSVNGYPFLFLGSERYRQSDPANEEDAFLSQEQLDWLSAALEKHKSADRLFVFLHQPLPYTVSGTYACCTNTRAVIRHEELKRLLDRYPQVIFFSGHTHAELKLPQTFVRRTFAMVNSSSVANPHTEDGNGKEQPLPPETSEGLFVEVYDNRVWIRGRNYRDGSWIPGASFVID